jgi:hypothetical protein
MIVWPRKDPDERFDYSWRVPLDSGDAIATFTPVKTSGTVSLDSSDFSNDLARVWLSGGADGETASFTLTVVTTGGRTFEEYAEIGIVSSNSASAALIAAFPRFADVPPASIEFWLTRAARAVDDSWAEDDRDIGQMLLAAHYLTLQGLGTGAEAEAGANGTGDYRSIRSGAITLERFDRAKNGAQGELASTSYGRQWLALARANRGGPRVTATGTLPYADLRYPQGEA